MSTTFNWIVTILMTFAAVLQIASARMHNEVPIVQTGRTLLGAGWALGATWFWYRIALGLEIYIPLPSAIFIGLIALGTICVCLYRVTEGIDAVFNQPQERVHERVHY